MNAHQALVAQAVELYSSLGHYIEDVAEIDEFRSDLLIRSSKSKKWVARCDSNDVITLASVKLFLTHLKTYKAHKAALITPGQLNVKGRALLAIKKVEFIDSATLARLQQSTTHKQAVPEQASRPMELESEKQRKQRQRRWIRSLLFGLLALTIILLGVILLAMNGWHLI